MTVLTKGIAVGEVVVYELDTRLTRETKVVQTGQDLDIGDVCEPGVVTTEKRIVSGAVNEVQEIVFAGTPTGGNFVLWIESLDGIMVPTIALAHNSSSSTINSALDVACNVGSGIVAVGTTLPDNTMVFTYSGTGYAGLPRKQIVADLSALTGGSPTAAETTTTQGRASGGLADSICLEAVAPVDEVQTIVFSGTTTGGNYTLSFMGLAGEVVTTGNIAHGDSMGTVNGLIDTAVGVTGGIVATGTNADANGTMTLTSSGAGFSGRPWRLVTIVSAMTGGTPTAGVQVIARSTTGKQNEAVFLTAGPAIVDKSELDYNSTTEATVDAALKALSIDTQTQPTYTTQST